MYLVFLTVSIVVQIVYVERIKRAVSINDCLDFLCKITNNKLITKENIVKK